MKLITAVLIIMLLLIVYAVTFCTPESKFYYLTATAYYPGAECTYPYDDGYTAIGHVAGRGSIAIDPVNGPLQFEQRVYVEDYGEGVCNDVGSAIKGWKIDLCFDTYEEAIEWGIKLVKVYVLEVK